VPELIVDCDVHPHINGGVEPLFEYLSAGWQKRLEGRKKGEQSITFAFRAPHFAGEGAVRLDAVPPGGGYPGSDAEFMVEDLLNRNKIDAAILIPLQPAMMERHLDADEAAVLVSAYNDYFYDHWLSVDDRFRMCVTVIPQDPELAAKEIRRFGAKKDVVAVYLATGDKLLGNRYYRPIFEAAVEMDLPIVLHDHGSRGHFQGSATFAVGVPTSQAERNTGMMQIGMGHLTSLLWEGTFERYPQLKVVFVEYDWTWVPSVMWRIESGWRAARSATPWVKRSPSEVLREHIRFTSQPGDAVPKEEWVNIILEQMYGDRTMLFATDYPHWDADEPEQVFRTASPEMKERIFWQNAADVFGTRLRLPELART
jgi:predicted TIM-barrel fold metal-dependent hydrolase